MALCEESIITLPDDFEGFSLDSFVIPKFYKPDISNVLIPQGLLRDRTKALAKEIIEKYANEEPIIAVGILNGCYRFFYELLEEMKTFQKAPIRVEFLKIKSYVNESSGAIEVQKVDDQLRRSFNGQKVLIVEDIVDTGNTLDALMRFLRDHSTEIRPKDVKIASLLYKRTKRNTCGLKPDFAGFSIADHFVVGCGYDYNSHYRDLPHVCCISEEGKKKHAIVECNGY